MLTLSIGTTISYAASKTLTHTIKSGDSLYQIALKNHTTVEQIRKANNMKEGEKLKLGRNLTIPAKSKLVKAEKAKPAKKVASSKKTESKKKVAVSKKTELKKKVASKKTTPPQKIAKKSSNKKIASKLSSKKIVKTAAAKPVSHTIQKGDSLYAIAKKHHTTVAAVRKANGMKATEKLKLGRVLKMPQDVHSKNILAKASVKKQKTTIAHTPKTVSDKKLVASIAKLDTISLKKAEVKKDKKPSLSTILFGAKKSKVAKSDSGIGTEKCVRITSLAKKKLGKRYVLGATGGRNTFDCSGLTTYVYKQNGIKLPRRAIAQSKIGKRISKKDLRKGDLVFFDTSRSRRGYVKHVGIYIGNNKFIHASSAKRKVIISSLNEPFYRNRLTGARRLES